MASPPTSSSYSKFKAEERYTSAAVDLQKVIPKDTCKRLGEITFPQFDTIHGIENRAKALRDALEKLIQARSELGKKREAKKGIIDITINCFRASYPFAKLFITVAKESSTVREMVKWSVNLLLDNDSQSLWSCLWGIACFDGCKNLLINYNSYS